MLSKLMWKRNLFLTIVLHQPNKTGGVWIFFFPCETNKMNAWRKDEGPWSNMDTDDILTYAFAMGGQCCISLLF